MVWEHNVMRNVDVEYHKVHYSRSAFHLNGKIGFPGGKPNGTGLSTENFSKKREYRQRYSSFLVFTGITGKSLYHLLYRTSAMLLGKNTRFRSRKWLPPSCLSVQHAVGRLYGSKLFHFDFR